MSEKSPAQDRPVDSRESHISIAEFEKMVTRLPDLPPPGLPEIAIAGRSNVGKSSLINRLLGRKKLARVSNTPGRTQALHFYRIQPQAASPDRTFYLVDMPGYGYAEVSLARRAEWAALIEGYLDARKSLRALVHIIDMRHPPQPLDYQMTEWLRETGLPYRVVATKADKVPRTKVTGQIAAAAQALSIDEKAVMAFSAETGLGREELWAWVQRTVFGR